MKILKGDFEHEANVATNLKRIVNRLPHDLIVKWQSVNYDIVRLGQAAKLQDIASFVKKTSADKKWPDIWNTTASDRYQRKELRILS